MGAFGESGGNPVAPYTPDANSIDEENDVVGVRGKTDFDLRRGKRKEMALRCAIRLGFDDFRRDSQAGVARRETETGGGNMGPVKESHLEPVLAVTDNARGSIESVGSLVKLDRLLRNKNEIIPIGQGDPTAKGRGLRLDAFFVRDQGDVVSHTIDPFAYAGLGFDRGEEAALWEA